VAAKRKSESFGNFDLDQSQFKRRNAERRDIMRDPSKLSNLHDDDIDSTFFLPELYNSATSLPSIHQPKLMALNKRG
jgi:hypothetical protein